MGASEDDRTVTASARAELGRWAARSLAQGSSLAEVLGMLVGAAVSTAKAEPLQLPLELFQAGVENVWQEGSEQAVVAIATRSPASLERARGAVVYSPPMTPSADACPGCGAEQKDARGGCLVCGWGH